MSLRIAVALAATIGASVLISTAAEARPNLVGFRGDFAPGTIVVRTNERHLYLVVGPDSAMRYPVGVGRSGKQWEGVTRIDGKFRYPAWSPLALSFPIQLIAYYWALKDGLDPDTRRHLQEDEFRFRMSRRLSRKTLVQPG